MYEDILKRLEHIESLLEQLVTPVAFEETRQLATASDEQRKSHSRAVLQRARERKKRRTE